MGELPAGAAPAALGRHRAALEEALQAAIGDEPAALVAASRYVMGWQDADGRPANATGKRIRPSLCLLAAEAVGGLASDAMPGAVAVELVHNFSLVHDEVQDHDAERHHRPTLWAMFGEAQAINAGDFLYTRAIQALSDGPGDVARRMAALQVLNRAIAAMIGGQWNDLAFEQRPDVAASEYLAMVAGKTGALLGAPLEMGALLAGATAEQASILGRWGRQVGLAFQAHDDYLGTWGDPGTTGKSNSNDIARKKKTLPIILGLAEPGARDVVVAAYAADGDVKPEAIAAVVAALEAVGADRACREQAAALAAEAGTLLDEARLEPEWRAILAETAGYLVRRAG